MFTGIVQEIGAIRRIETRSAAGASEDQRIEVSFAAIARDRLNLGDSISVDGVCLTVAALNAFSFHADVSGETLRVTTLGAKPEGSPVNLEPALRAGDSLGGHWVSGHVDGIADVLATANDARSLRVEFAAPHALARYIARKGSVTLDGVSLTVNEVDGVKFSVNLIPHTLEVTTLGRLAAGARVNLEIDTLARYVERLSEYK
ncbi:MAG TPA: riboflavin synthase [Steroidobacteraceae bacterium]